MSRTWTRAAATIVAGLVLTACGGSNSSENHIKPIRADITIDPFPGIPDPAIYLEEVSRSGDLVTVNVNLHNGTGGPIDFDAFTLEITYDFTRVQIGDVFEVNPAVLGDCFSGDACSPTCMNTAVDANKGLPPYPDGRAHFILGVAALANCPTATVTSDVRLVTLAFIASTTIDPPGSPIQFISGSGRGDCEILSGLVDLGLPCIDGNATLTATR